MSADATPIDSDWIARNPLPVHASGTTKNSRGRVLIVGGSRAVPGALRLTGEAALRAGAGKIQLATVAAAAITLGMMVPEAGVIALPEDEEGEIGAGDHGALAKPLARCDALVLGPGIGTKEAAAALIRFVLEHPCEELTLVIDAVAIGCGKDLRDDLARLRGRLILTPHHGELAALTGEDEGRIAEDPAAFARRVAADFGAVVVLKGSDTVIADSQGRLLHYGGGGTGLATAGSGDVLAGAIGGLLSRGASPLVGSGWGVWLHGQAGRRAATTRGPIGFLAREVPPEFPRLLPQ